MKGNEGSWGSQAIDLAPAQGAIVEFTTTEDGLYPIVTHAFNFVGRGALGLVQAGDGGKPELRRTSTSASSGAAIRHRPPYSRSTANRKVDVSASTYTMNALVAPLRIVPVSGTSRCSPAAKVVFSTSSPSTGASATSVPSSSNTSQLPLDKGNDALAS